MELSKQLYREIEELQVKELFRAYNPDHMERKHILVTDGDLLQRLCRIKIEKDEIILCTKFSEPLDEVLNLIHDCILKNTRDIEKWNPLKTDLVLHMPLGKVIGYGYVQRTDTTRPFKMSAIRIILSASPVKGRLLAVRTAYPVPDSDEIDEGGKPRMSMKTSFRKTGKKKRAFNALFF